MVLKPDYLGLNPSFVTYWLFELGSLPGTQWPGFLLLSEGQVVIVPTLEAVVRTGRVSACETGRSAPDRR